MTFLLALSVLAQAAPAPPKQAATRLEFMKQALAVHTLQPAGDPKVTFRLQADPAIRFTNEVGTVTDGTVFFWLDADGRPAAAVQVYRTRSGSWHQAFSSLSKVPLTTGTAWNPTRAGVLFKPVPGAPKPAKTPEQRMRQMHGFLDGFKAEMNLELKTWHTLRALTKPLVRYGKAGTGVLDGGLFTFALTTDPEVFLLLEAQEGPDGPEWRYAFAPEASAPIRCSWKGKEVWTFDFQDSDNASNAPYFDWGFAQGP